MPSYNPYMWFPPQYRQAGGSAVIIIIAIVVLLILDKPLDLGIQAAIKKLLGDKGADEAGLDSKDDHVRGGFNAENEAVSIKTALDKSDYPWQGQSNHTAFNKILAYNNNELRSVHNAWLKKYKGQTNDTLRKQVEAESAIRDDTRKLRTKVIARLDKLSL